MSKYTIEDTTLTAIADALRAADASAEAITPEEMPEKVEGVFAAGAKSEYDRFWDTYQQNGQKTDYSLDNGNFAGECWTDDLFRPKYPMTIHNAYMMFRRTSLTDLTKPGVVLDFSKCGNIAYAFAYNRKLNKLPIIDMSSATNSGSAFADYKGAELSIILSETTPIGTMLIGAKSLASLTIGGTIGQDASFQWCPLSHDSLMSIINALKDYSEDTSGTVWTVTLGDANLAKLSEEEIGIAEEKGWVLA